MLHPINVNGLQKYSSISYDDYDYSSFWKGRAYEDRADRIAVSRFLHRVPVLYDRLADIGAGRGRLLPLYEERWKAYVLIDPSRQQLDYSLKNAVHPERMQCLVGTTEKIPLLDESIDTILCTRVFHYILNPVIAIEEMQRILRPGGHLILEIPNKFHFKNRVVSVFKRNHASVVSANPMNKMKSDFVFVNHNPKTIRAILQEHRFEVVDILSVSNFRSCFMKKIIPIGILSVLERTVQKPLASIWFGPSIYFFVKKK